ncbi:hypothetical protein GCM10023322_42880 [Rugosimonospora acidiphila]|uniref:OmpR/PhoB-type domain-containing protein n=1 Tax=Rugosimonospora acidiphila TaxID=556531 RepID=A0ABP9S186_9ACTN
MEFRVLGAVEVLTPRGTLSVGPPQRRAVLAALLVDAGRPVPPEVLLGRVWDDAPDGARRALHAHITRLRRLLADGGQPATLVRRSGGYALDIAPGDIDLHRFHGLVAAARTSRRAHGERSALLRRALGLWHGMPLADVAGDWAARTRQALLRQRLDAAVLLTDVELQRGAHGAVIQLVRELLVEYPLAEPLHAALMRALVAAGRQAEALDTFAALRTGLRDGLGAEPGAQLHELHQAILLGRALPATAPDPVHDGPIHDGPIHDGPIHEGPAGGPHNGWPHNDGPHEDHPHEHPAHDSVAHGTPAPTRSRPTGVAAEGEADADTDAQSPSSPPQHGAPHGTAPPRCLPRDLADFTGREPVLHRLLDAVSAERHPTTAPIILSIDGMPGVGKTTLAVHFAHRVAGRYPDAQLYIDLLGHDADAPLETGAALDTLLRQLGVPGDRIPDRLDERITLWRGELAGRRALLMLDNAATSDQILPILPAEPGCLTLVTSRRRLPELDGATTLSLDVLTTAEAIALQRRIAGDRVTSAPEAAEEVARRCGHLPLAIRLAAARLAHRPSWGMSGLAERLRTAVTPLRELVAGGRTVEAAFALSYQQLRPAVQVFFRRLGGYPGLDITSEAAAALVGIQPAEADEVLTELVDAHLVEERVAGRYGLHDLLREYASQLASADPPARRRTATVRLLTYYLHVSATGAAFLEPNISMPFEYSLEPVPAWIRPLGDESAAEDWFEAERANLVAAIQLAAEERHDRLCWRLTRAVWRDLYYRGYDDACLHTHRLAIEAADRAGEPEGVALGHNSVAAMHFRRGRWDQALRHLDEAIALRAALGDRAQQASSLNNKATVLNACGRYRQALAVHREALALWLAMPQPNEGALLSYSNMGQSYMYAGDYAAAEETYVRLTELADALDSDRQRNIVYGHVGELRLKQGRFAEAVELLTRRRLAPTPGDPLLFAETVRLLGTAHRGLGQLQEALHCHRQSLSILQETGALFSECDSHLELAATLRALGDRPAALDEYRQALDIGGRLNLERQVGEAVEGLARLDTGSA